MTDENIDITVDVQPILATITAGFLKVERESREAADAATAHLPPEIRATIELHRRQVLDAIIADTFRQVVSAVVTFREAHAPPVVVPAPPIPDPPPGSLPN